MDIKIAQYLSLRREIGFRATLLVIIQIISAIGIIYLHQLNSQHDRYSLISVLFGMSVLLAIYADVLDTLRCQVNYSDKFARESLGEADETWDAFFPGKKNRIITIYASLPFLLAFMESCCVFGLVVSSRDLFQSLALTSILGIFAMGFISIFINRLPKGE